MTRRYMNGWMDETFEPTQMQTIEHKGYEVSYTWGYGAEGMGYGVIFEDEWLIFDKLEAALDFQVLQAELSEGKS